jgi:hypothetical protein
MSTFRRASLMAVLLVGLGALPMGHAVGASSVLGTIGCAPTGPLTDNVEYTSAGLKNKSTATLTIVCSLFRDNTSNTNGMQDLEISLFDQTGGTKCAAFSFDRKGFTKKMIEKVNSTVGEAVIDFGGALNASVSKGYYAVSCSLTPQSILRSIYYVEP